MSASKMRKAFAQGDLKSFEKGLQEDLEEKKICLEMLQKV